MYGWEDEHCRQQAGCGPTRARPGSLVLDLHLDLDLWMLKRGRATVHIAWRGLCIVARRARLSLSSAGAAMCGHVSCVTEL